MAIYMWRELDTRHFATQWPCPDNFHVPLQSEWDALCLLLTSSFWLSANGDTLRTYLKMPFVWHRWSSSWNLTLQWDYGYYWTCTWYSNDEDKAYIVFFNSSYLFPYGSSYPRQPKERSAGCSVRAFKNVADAPDSSWTALYSDKIYHSSSLWLISIKNWSDWITIADKNLWATTVYNSWDTLSETNCGKYYQWGNNYGFPFTWYISKSTTQVDASNYWPWNYYSSNIFIYRPDYAPYDWSSVHNNNLRWWVDGNVPIS